MRSIQDRLDECCVNAMSIIWGMRLIRGSTCWTGSLKTMSLMEHASGHQSPSIATDMPDLSDTQLNLLAAQCEKLSLSIREIHMTMKRSDCDALLVPAHVVKIVTELAMWANYLNVEVLSALNSRITENQSEKARK